MVCLPLQSKLPNLKFQVSPYGAEKKLEEAHASGRGDAAAISQLQMEKAAVRQQAEELEGTKKELQGQLQAARQELKSMEQNLTALKVSAV